MNVDSGALKFDKGKKLKIVTRDDMADPDWEKEYESEELNFDDHDMFDDERALNTCLSCIYDEQANQELCFQSRYRF